MSQNIKTNGTGLLAMRVLKWAIGYCQRRRQDLIMKEQGIVIFCHRCREIVNDHAPIASHHFDDRPYSVYSYRCPRCAEVLHYQIGMFPMCALLCDSDGNILC